MKALSELDITWTVDAQSIYLSVKVLVGPTQTSKTLTIQRDDKAPIQTYFDELLELARGIQARKWGFAICCATCSHCKTDYIGDSEYRSCSLTSFDLDDIEPHWVCGQYQPNKEFEDLPQAETP